ncbi:MAG: diphthine synthase [Thermoplasmata archaeon]
MSTLHFVGAGLGDEESLSRRAWRLLEGCQVLFAEQYTSLLDAGAIERLAKGLGRPIHTLGRDEVEAGHEILSALDRGSSVALLVAGDPFAATTHVALRVEVEGRGHDWTYTPNASILTAAASYLGLMHYRFGRVVSVPFPAPGFLPRSPQEALLRNRESGLHTLVLLDLDPSGGRFLAPQDALRMLEAGEPHPNLGDSVAVVARVGRPDVGAWVGPTRSLARIDFGPPLHTIIVPAPELHFAEEAAVRRFRVP